jgi:endonuclease III
MSKLVKKNIKMVRRHQAESLVTMVLEMTQQTDPQVQRRCKVFISIYPQVKNHATKHTLSVLLTIRQVFLLIKKLQNIAHTTKSSSEASNVPTPYK